MREFSCGAVGAIQNSGKSGHMVRVDDDTGNSGGFLILEWRDGSTGPNANGAFDSWVDSEAGVTKFLDETDWCIVWR
jgi:hypothetical protein